jgi:hypothetical protein
MDSSLLTISTETHKERRLSDFGVWGGPSFTVSAVAIFGS